LDDDGKPYSYNACNKIVLTLLMEYKVYKLPILVDDDDDDDDE